MNYNERTGRFGTPKYYSYGNAPALVTHFDGITAVPGGFNLVAISSAQACVHGVRPGHRRQLALVRHGDVVSHRCRGKPAVLQRAAAW